MTFDTRFSRARSGGLRLRITGTGDHKQTLDDLGLISLERAPHLKPAAVARTWERSKGVGFRTLTHMPSGRDWQVTLTADNPDGIARLLDALAHHPSPDAQALAARLTERFDRLTAAGPPTPRTGGFGDAELRALVRARPTPADALVIDELGIDFGAVRTDVAVLADDCWTGVEIKGVRDSTVRLPRQVAAYSAVFDRCEVLTVPEHVDSALRLVPDWWQVTAVDADGAYTVQAGQDNPAPSATARVNLLWRDEAYGLLQLLGLARRMSSARRDAICGRLGEALSAEQARTEVMSRLRRRDGWLTRDGAGRVGLLGRV